VHPITSHPSITKNQGLGARNIFNNNAPARLRSSPDTLSTRPHSCAFPKSPSASHPPQSSIRRCRRLLPWHGRPMPIRDEGVPPSVLPSAEPRTTPHTHSQMARTPKGPSPINSVVKSRFTAGPTRIRVHLAEFEESQAHTRKPEPPPHILRAAGNTRGVGWALKRGTPSRVFKNIFSQISPLQRLAKTHSVFQIFATFPDFRRKFPPPSSREGEPHRARKLQRNAAPKKSRSQNSGSQASPYHRSGRWRYQS